MPTYAERMEKLAGQELSPRETEIMELVVAGARNSELSEKLGISYQTTKNHMTSIYAKMGVRNRTEAAVRYIDTVIYPNA